MRHFTCFALFSILSFTAVAHTRVDPPDVGDLIVASAPHVHDLALAQVQTPAPVIEAPVVAQSPLGSFFSQFLTPTGIASVVLTILGLVGGLLGLNALRKRQIAIVTQHAYNGVLDFSKTTETTIDDKIAAGLKIADDWMKAQGWRTLSDKEQEVVKLGFNAIHGSLEAAKQVTTAVPPKA